ncbi:MAG: PAS domain S-box protein, partial [Syntrophomonadaceae bacterium]|nr:PAS domain S-box protein [Syntrophomonadaceae bacterium]
MKDEATSPSLIAEAEDTTALKQRIIELEMRNREQKLLTELYMKKVDHLKEMLDSIQEVVIIVDRRFTVEYITPNGKAITGWEVNECKGCSILEPIHPDDVKMALETIRAIKDTKSRQTIECRFRHAQGHYIWIEASGGLLQDENGQMKGLIISACDVSKRKSIEEKLRATETELNERVSHHNLLAENINEVFCTCDLDSRFTLVSKRV